MSAEKMYVWEEFASVETCVSEVKSLSSLVGPVFAGPVFHDPFTYTVCKFKRWA